MAVMQLLVVLAIIAGVTYGIEPLPSAGPPGENKPKEDGKTPPVNGQTPPVNGHTPTDGRTPSENGWTPTNDGWTRSEDGRTPSDGRTSSDDGWTRPEDGRTRTEDGRMRPDGVTGGPSVGAARPKRFGDAKKLIPGYKPNGCPSGTVYCMRARRCVSKKCAFGLHTDPTTNGGNTGRVRNSLIPGFGNGKPSCMAGYIYCMQRRRCVSQFCYQEGVIETVGQCPVADKNGDSVCSARGGDTCSSDFMCRGGTKCCDTGRMKACRFPDLDPSDELCGTNPVYVGKQMVGMRKGMTLKTMLAAAETTARTVQTVKFVSTSIRGKWMKAGADAQWSPISTNENLVPSLSVRFESDVPGYWGVTLMNISVTTATATGGGETFDATLTMAIEPYFHMVPPVPTLREVKVKAGQVITDFSSLNYTWPDELMPRVTRCEAALVKKGGSIGISIMNSLQSRLDCLSNVYKEGNFGVRIRLNVEDTSIKTSKDVPIKIKIGRSELRYESKTTGGRAWFLTAEEAEKASITIREEVVANFELLIWAWSGEDRAAAGPPGLSAERTSIMFKVTPKNDPPQQKLGQGRKPVDFSYPDGEAAVEGRLIGEMIDSLYTDDSLMEMAVLLAMSSPKGNYEIKVNGSDDWEAFAVNGNMQLQIFTVSDVLKALRGIGKSYEEVEAMYKADEELPDEIKALLTELTATILARNTRIRFIAKEMWAAHDAEKYSLLIFAPIEVRNGEETSREAIVKRAVVSTVDVTYPICPDCGDKEMGQYNFATATKTDCAGKAQGTQERDECGVCGGKQECFDCSGVKNGNKTLYCSDQCKKLPKDEETECLALRCVENKDDVLDCKGNCEPTYTRVSSGILEGKCLKLDGITLKDFIDKIELCDGELSGNARTLCGECIDGTTGRTASDVLNECNRCNNTEECTNCKQTKNACGQCVDRGMHINSGCLSLVSADPVIVPASSVNVTIKGSFNGFQVSSCEMADAALSDVTVASATSGEGMISVTLTGLTVAMVGEREIRCAFSAAEDTETTSYTLNFVPAPVLDGFGGPVNLDSFRVMEKVQVKGRNFPQTLYFHCYLGCPETIKKVCSGREFKRLKGTYVNETTVTCDVSRFARAVTIPVELPLSVVFSNSKTENDKNKWLTANLLLVAAAPVAQSAEYVSSCLLALDFDQIVVSNSWDCSHIFDNTTITLLGDNSKCSPDPALKRRIIVSPGNPVARGTGLELTFATSGEARLRTRGSEDYLSGSIAVGTPSYKFNVKQFDVQPSLSKCQSLELKAKASNCEGLGWINFNWTVSYDGNATGATLAAIEANMADVRTALSNSEKMKLSSDMIVAGQELTFNLSVTDVNGMAVPQMTQVVKREAGESSISVTLGSERVVNPADQLKIKARTRKVSCTGEASSNPKVDDYFWSSSHPEFNVDEWFSGSIVNVPANSLKGAREYTVSVDVKADDGAVVTSEVKIITRQVPLKANLELSAKTISISQSLSLDASLSVDENKFDTVPEYTFICGKLDDGIVPCQSGVDTILAAATGDTVDLPANSFTPGTYMLRVTMRKSGLQAASTQFIEVIQEVPPSVKLELFGGPKTAFNPEKTVLVASQIRCEGTITDIEWISELKGPDGEKFELADLTKGEEMLKDRSILGPCSAALIRYPMVFKGVIGEKYLLGLKLTVTKEGSEVVVTNRQDVAMATKPGLTGVEVSPSVGQAFNTTFVVTAVREGENEDDEIRFLYKLVAVYDGVEGKPKKLNIIPTGDGTYEGQLPSGTYRIVVKAVNSAGISTEQTLKGNVTVKERSSEELGSIIEDLANEGALGYESTMTLINSLYDSADDMTTETKAALEEVTVDEVTKRMDGITININTNVGEVIGALEETLYLTANLLLGGENAQKEGATNKVVQTGKALVDSMTNGFTEGSSEEAVKRRKKRATQENSGVNSVDEEQATILVNTASASIKLKTEDVITSTESTDFLNTLHQVLQGLCASVKELPDIGEDPVAEVDLGSFGIQHRSFSSSLNGATMPIACGETCPNTISHAANYSVTSAFESAYDVWACEGGQCAGGCLATTQLTTNLFTAQIESLSPASGTLVSDVIGIHFLAAELQTYETVSVPSGAFEFVSEIRVSANTGSYSYECRKWNSTLLDWENKCESGTPTYSSAQLKWIVTCTCDNTGYFGIFEDQIVTTVPITTTLSVEDLLTGSSSVTPASTVSPVVVADGQHKLVMTFSLNADWDLVMQSNTEEEVKIIVITSIKLITGVTGEQLIQVTLTRGSIVVSFMLVSPEAGSSGADLTTAANALQTFVTTAQTITISGVAYPADTSSFSAEPPADEPPEGKKPGNVGLYIGLGVAGALVITLGVVVALVLMKKTNAKVSNSPRESHMELGHASMNRSQQSMSHGSSSIPKDYTSAPGTDKAAPIPDCSSPIPIGDYDPVASKKAREAAGERSVTPGRDSRSSSAGAVTPVG